MSKERFEKPQAQLTLKEKVDYPDLIRDAILTCNRSVLATENSDRENVEATKNLRSLIPKDFEDEEFAKELAEAKIKRNVDVRPLVAGSTRMSEDACKRLGIPHVMEEETYDYEMLRRACINFFARTGMFSSMNLVENLENIDFARIAKATTRADNVPSK